MFSIEINRESLHDDGTRPDHAVGVIFIDGFVESFRVPLGYWSIDDYRQSWCAALHVLEEYEHSRSCLAVSMSDPETTNYIFLWPLYREADVVYVQNSVLFLDEVKSFSPGSPWLSVPLRERINEDGQVISEWMTDMASIREFSQSIC
jgi:CdiI N-terminal domain